jgi:hypothetical protein
VLFFVARISIVGNVCSSYHLSLVLKCRIRCCYSDMPVAVKTIDVPTLVQMLQDKKNNNQKTALILGGRAGALYRSAELYDWLQQSSKRDFTGMSVRDRFSECYSVLRQLKAEEGTSPRDIKSGLMRALGKVRFSEEEDFVIELVQQGLFQIILYNNADDLLYDAFIGSGLKEQIDFVDCPLEYLPIEGAMQESLERIAYEYKQDACRLVRAYKDIDAFVRALDRPKMQEESSRYLKHLLFKLRAREALIVGLDAQWDRTLLSALPPQIKTVWFVNEDESMKDMFLMHNQQIDQFHYVVGGHGEYKMFTRALYFQVNQGLPRGYELLRELIPQQHFMLHVLLELSEKYESMRKDIELTRKLLRHLEERLDDRD